MSIDHNPHTTLSVDEDRLLTLYDPATAKVMETLPMANRHDVGLTVSRARHTFYNGWNQSPLNERIALLQRLHTAIEDRNTAFAESISKEVGSPIDFARTQQVEAALSHIRATLDAASRLSNNILTKPDDKDHRTCYEAAGVAALITPWNWPLNQAVLKISGALIAGCTIVLKPSELTPATSHLLKECADDAGIPEGVFNLIIGDSETGRNLTTHPDVDIISFTGSTTVGREISVKAAENFKPAILELGGKSPNLLFADCHLETAVQQGVAHCFRNAGQSCNAASRMLVERSVYEDVIELAGREAKNTLIDLPTKPGEHIGPLISRTQFDRVQNYIAAGIKEEAQLVTGGLGHPRDLQQGYFVRPTVFADVTPDMTIFREEIFGPVLTITPFEDEEHAIALANDTSYGLAAYIQSIDPRRLDRVAKQLQVGMVQVNGSSRASGTAFGGIKASGIGREAGLWGIRAFQNIKSISGVGGFDTISFQPSQHIRPSLISP